MHGTFKFQYAPGILMTIPTNSEYEIQVIVILRQYIVSNEAKSLPN